MRAGFRLHSALLQTPGIVSHVLVKRKTLGDASVVEHSTSHKLFETLESECAASPVPLGVDGLQTYIEPTRSARLVQELYLDKRRSRLTNTIFTFTGEGLSCADEAIVREADVLNLHWVTGFLGPRSIAELLQLGKPVIWTFHDLWAMTGGCHYASGCRKFETACTSDCPQLTSDPCGLVPAAFSDRLAAYGEGRITVVTPSRWMGREAQASRIFKGSRVEVIPYGLDLDAFSPMPRAAAREQFGIPEDATVFLFACSSAAEERKGTGLLRECIRSACTDPGFEEQRAKGKIWLVFIGWGTQESMATNLLQEVHLGFVRTDEKLREVFSAADALINLSTEDNLPNMVLEAMACGTSVIGFDVGGMPDMIVPGETGHLVPVGDVYQVADKLVACANNREATLAMGVRSRQAMERNFPAQLQADRYAKLYEELLAAPRPSAPTFTPRSGQVLQLAVQVGESLWRSTNLANGGTNWELNTEEEVTDIVRRPAAIADTSVESESLGLLRRQLNMRDAETAWLKEIARRQADHIEELTRHSRRIQRNVGYKVVRGFYNLVRKLRGKKKDSDKPASFIRPVMDKFDRVTRGLSTGAPPSQELLDYLETMKRDFRAAFFVSPTMSNLDLHHRLAVPGQLHTCLQEIQIWPQSPRLRSLNLTLELVLDKHPNVLAEADFVVIHLPYDKHRLAALGGHLLPHQRLLIHGAPEDVAAVAKAAPPHKQGADFAFYFAPPPAWLDPYWNDLPEKTFGNPVWRSLAQKPPALMPNGKEWPKITVVTPSFKMGHYIEDTILSVLDQGYPNLEYLVLDGGSPAPDATPAILDKYRDRLTYAVSEKDKGQSDALNKGFARSTGEIMTWINSDDRLAPGSLFRMAMAFELYPEADVISGVVAHVRGDGKDIVSTHRALLPMGRVITLPLDRLLALEDCWQAGHFFYQPEVFWRRRIWEAAGSRVASEMYYSFDYALWVRFAMAGAKYVRIPDTIAIFRFHDAQKTHGKTMPFLPELIRVNKALIDEAKEKGIYKQHVPPVIPKAHKGDVIDWLAVEEETATAPQAAPPGPSLLA